MNWRSLVAALLVLCVLGCLSLLPPLATGGERAAAEGNAYRDDGRYDYGLSQPDPSIQVLVEENVFIPTRDGTRLQCDIYRPDKPGRYPVIMAFAPYPRRVGAGVMPGVDDNGGVGTRYWYFEQANPEYWVPRGYIYISVSTRGYGGSEGITNALSYFEARDYYDAVEWAAAQPWSTGKIGLYGISYYAMSQYWVAGLRPPHLAAIVPWEGLLDPYRDIAYRGGIPCMFGVFFALGLQLIANNIFLALPYLPLYFMNPLMNEMWEKGLGILFPDGRDTPKIIEEAKHLEVPMLSVGCLNDPDLHLRGNVVAFQLAGSPEKRLMLYSGTHWGSAYQPWANRTVLRFFDHYLKGMDTGLDEEPRVDVALRTGPDTFTHVYGNSWPLENTQWTRLYMDAERKSLVGANPAREASVQAVFEADEYGSGERVTFMTEPLTEDVRIAGPVSAHFWVSTTGRDVDLSVELRAIDENGREIRFPYYVPGSPDEPVSRGWLRASLRALDPERTRPYQPWYTFRENQWLTPGVPVPVDVEIWPTAMLFKAGWRIALTIYCGTHNRAGEGIFALELPFIGKWFLRVPAYQTLSPDPGDSWVHAGGEHESWLLLPVIPEDPSPRHRVRITGAGFDPSPVTMRVGDVCEWTNEDSDYHSVTEVSGLRLWDSQLINGTRSHNPETWWLKARWAGTFTYRDMVSGHEGTLEVAPVAEAVEGGRVSVMLACEPPREDTGFDLQVRSDDGDWVTVAEGIRDARATLELGRGRHEIRCRLRGQGGTEAASGWSPPVAVTIE